MKNLIDSDIGNYHIVDLLGKGGMATVYRARQESMGRDVAIKGWQRSHIALKEEPGCFGIGGTFQADEGGALRGASGDECERE